MKIFFILLVLISNYIRAIISHDKGLILTTKVLKSFGYTKHSKIFDLKYHNIKTIASNAFSIL